MICTLDFTFFFVGNFSAVNEKENLVLIRLLNWQNATSGLDWISSLEARSKLWANDWCLLLIFALKAGALPMVFGMNDLPQLKQALVWSGLNLARILPMFLDEIKSSSFNSIWSLLVSAVNDVLLPGQRAVMIPTIEKGKLLGLK